GDASRGRFLAEFTKDARQFLFAVIVHDCRRCEARSRVHSHVEWTVSNQTEPAFCVFQLPRRNPQIKERAADRANPELVENTIPISEICLPHNDAPAKMRQTLGHVPDCIRVLIQSQNVGATLQKRFRVAAAATCSVEDRYPRFRLE